MIAYKDPDMNLESPTIIGGKTGNLTTGIVEQYGRPYWRQFDIFPVRIYGYVACSLLVSLRVLYKLENCELKLYHVLEI